MATITFNKMYYKTIHVGMVKSYFWLKFFRANLSPCPLEFGKKRIKEKTGVEDEFLAFRK